MTAAPKLTVTRGREYSPSPRVVQVSPTLAERLLSTNSKNRPLVAGRVEKYARDMTVGNWKMNAETVKIDVNGDLLDGQHRLWAVIESGATVPLMIVEGLDPEVMPTIDTGRARTAADALSLASGAKSAALLAGALRWMYWYGMRPRPENFNTARPTHSELITLYEGNPDFNEAVRAAHNHVQAKRLVPGSILVFTYAMAVRVDAAKAGAWLQLLNDGSNMDVKHPVHQLRERMIANRGASAKLTPMDVAALAAKSWAQFLTGKRTTNLRWAAAEDFPSFGGVAPKPRKRAKAGS